MASDKRSSLVAFRLDENQVQEYDRDIDINDDVDEEKV